jgi:preprotein translocase subunit YajC
MSFAFIAQAAPSGAGGIISFLPFVLILVVFYFLLIRPQMKKQKEHTNMLKSTGRGDDIVTSGGLHGKVVGVNEKDNTFQVQIAKGIIVNLERGSVGRRKAAGSSETSTPEPKSVELKSRRPEREPSSREASGSGQPVSAMVVSGNRTAVKERPSGDGGPDGAKKSRYRRSRRRSKPPGFQPGQQGSPSQQGRPQGSEPTAEPVSAQGSAPSPQETTSERSSGES